MNAATRGVILAVAAVILGVVILGQGFSDSSPTLQAGASSDDGGGDGGSDDDGSAVSDDSSSDDDGSASSDDGGDDGSASSDDASGDDGSSDDGSTTDDGSTSSDDGSSQTPDILHPPAEVRVLVANGTSISGAAGRATDQLVANRGYGGLTPTNADAVTESAIYYVPGYELDARQIAQILNAPPESVAALPSDPPVSELSEAHVLVVLGPDLVSS